MCGIVVAAGKKGGLAIGNFPHVLMEKQGRSTRVQTSLFVPHSLTTPYDAICGFAVHCWSENSDRDIQNSHFYYMLLLNYCFNFNNHLEIRNH